MRKAKMLLALLLAVCMTATMLPVCAAPASEKTAVRSVQSGITLDENPEDGYKGDYVVIYNPSVSAEDVCSTGTMTGLIDTAVNPSIAARSAQTAKDYVIDVDAQMDELAKQQGIAELLKPQPEKREPVTLYHVGDTTDFEIYAAYSPTGSGTVTFKCLYVGEHCYIWTPVEDNGVTYPLDTLGADFAEIAAAEFDSKFDLMQSSFGEHFDFGTGDNRLHMLYYNINEGWEPGRGYIAGFFYAVDLMQNDLPILNIDTYPGVYYPDYYGEGSPWVRTDSTYHTMVHEYQHLINFSNNYTKGTMHSWLNECFSAAAEEICYPGSSVVPRIQAWEQFYPSDEAGWLTPPAEFAYRSDFNLHNGYSLYDWSNDLSDILALYAQVSFFAQYLYTRFDNSIYRQINDVFEQNGAEAAAITAATGVDCSEFAKDFRVAVTANAALDQYDGLYGFDKQEGYDPTEYHNVENPWDLLGPVVYTGTSCDIKGGGAITVKPVSGVYHPPEDADPNLVYIGIQLKPRASFTVGFTVCGTALDSQTALENDSITLPSSVDTEVEGWSFVGWSETQVAETSEEPAYYASGASYYVEDNVTFYALYMHGEDSDVRYNTEPAIIHSPVLVPAAPASCTEPGNSAYYSCATCDKLFSDESCMDEIGEESTVVDPTGHTPGEPVRENETDPTCTEVGGYDMATYCTVCKAELAREHTEIPAPGHTPGEPVRENETDPTCIDPGGYDMATYCTVCKAELAREHTEIPAPGHTPGEPVRENETDPTCIDPGGYDMATYCTVCKAELAREHTEIPAPGHTPGEPAKEDEIAPTCTESGGYAMVTRCTVCLTELDRVATEILATGHNFENGVCTVCGAADPDYKPPENPFVDVSGDDWFYNAVMWATSLKPPVTNGTDETHFAPTRKCTRAEVVQFLYNWAGKPAVTTTENPFEDVSADEWYYTAVLWAVENNITNGTDATHFAPAKTCTRAEVVQFVWNAKGKQAGSGDISKFIDVPADAWYKNALAWAIEYKVTSGTDDTHFAPTNKCTRAEIVQFIYKASTICIIA